MNLNKTAIARKIFNNGFFRISFSKNHFHLCNIFRPGYFFIFLLALLFFVPFAAKTQSPPAYNVLFIAVDDMNDRVNFMGWPEVPSPNIQRLLNRGMFFNNATL